MSHKLPQLVCSAHSLCTCCYSMHNVRSQPSKREGTGINVFLDVDYFEPIRAPCSCERFAQGFHQENFRNSTKYKRCCVMLAEGGSIRKCDSGCQLDDCLREAGLASTNGTCAANRSATSLTAMSRPPHTTTHPISTKDSKQLQEHWQANSPHTC